MHYIAAGLEGEIEVIIDGSAGYYTATMAHGPRISVKGSAGDRAGALMKGGTLIIGEIPGSWPGCT